MKEEVRPQAPEEMDETGEVQETRGPAPVEEAANPAAQEPEKREPEQKSDIPSGREASTPAAQKPDNPPEMESPVETERPPEDAKPLPAQRPPVPPEENIPSSQTVETKEKKPDTGVPVPEAPPGGGKKPVERRSGSGRRKQDQRNGKPVVIYVLLLFSMALLLMGLSSLIHQRSTLGALGQLHSDLSAMREVQNFQERIIALQESRQDLENQVKAVQSDMAALLSQTQEERNRYQALQYLYLLEMKFQSGRYQDCQVTLNEFERSGLPESLPADAPDSGVVSPMERYRQIREATAARMAEVMGEQTVEDGGYPDYEPDPGEGTEEPPVPYEDWGGPESYEGGDVPAEEAAYEGGENAWYENGGEAAYEGGGEDEALYTE